MVKKEHKNKISPKNLNDIVQHRYVYDDRTVNTAQIKRSSDAKDLHTVISGLFFGLFNKARCNFSAPYICNRLTQPKLTTEIINSTDKTFRR